MPELFFCKLCMKQEGRLRSVASSALFRVVPVVFQTSIHRGRVAERLTGEFPWTMLASPVIVRKKIQKLSAIWHMVSTLRNKPKICSGCLRQQEFETKDHKQSKCNKTPPHHLRGGRIWPNKLHIGTADTCYRNVTKSELQGET